MWYGRYVYMWPAKALIAFDIRCVLVAWWYLVSGIVISESCDHCRLRAAKLDWNVDCARLLHKLTGKLMDGWVSRNTKHIERVNLILIRKWSVNLVRHLTLCAFTSIDDGDWILWQVLNFEVDCKAALNFSSTQTPSVVPSRPPSLSPFGALFQIHTLVPLMVHWMPPPHPSHTSDIGSNHTYTHLGLVPGLIF